MDFLEIRRKAKERAAARARQAEARKAQASPAGPEAGGERPARGGRQRGRAGAGPDTVVTDADVLEGKLMAELQGPPEPPPAPEPPAEPGEGFLIAARGPRPGSAVRGEAVGQPAPAAPIQEPEPGGRPAPPDPLDPFFYSEDEPGSPILDRGIAAEPPAEAPLPSPAPREYLGFFLGDEEYALEIAAVREILRAPPITEVPRAPRDVLGVVTVRGEVVPVLDPRRRLGLPAAAVGRGYRVVVCQVGDAHMGVLVDRVTQVVRLPEPAIEARPQGIGAADPSLIAGIGREGDRLFILLELGALLGAPPVGAGERPA
jgi:purine-binding chemotaxis protein CheW